MNDLISRQAAIDALKHNQDVYSHNFHDDPIDKYTTAIIATDIDSLVNLPSAQPERIRGRWVERWHENKHVIGDMACSVCGAQMLLTFPRFCPNCGADMRGEKLDESD